MKKLIQATLAIWFAAGVMASCNTKVDLYADYKDVTVVYGLLDVTQDTNMVKIVRAFSGSDETPIDATQVALIADSSNYPGKLDARIVELKSSVGSPFAATGREIILDTMTLHGKNPGAFYHPDQKVYFTTEKFNQNTATTKYKYKLVVNKASETISAETGIVGGTDFRIITNSVTFRADAGDKTGKVKFTAADNAVVYEVKMAFNYKEKRPGQDTVYKRVDWTLGTKSVSELETESTLFVANYSQGLLFNKLRDAIGDDVVNVERFIGNFELHIAAGGEELYNYIQINAPSESLSQTIPDYTNVNGGFGVFSSRVNVSNILSPRLGIAGITRTELLGMDWGFREL